MTSCERRQVKRRQHRIDGFDSGDAGKKRCRLRRIIGRQNNPFYQSVLLFQVSAIATCGLANLKWFSSFSDQQIMRDLTEVAGG